ncbi:MAG: hypothetical protein ABSA46_15720 [Thermodesulfovibrionales bacterium]
MNIIKLTITCYIQLEIITIIPKHDCAKDVGKSAECSVSLVNELFNRFNFVKLRIRTQLHIMGLRIRSLDRDA